MGPGHHPETPSKAHARVRLFLVAGGVAAILALALGFVLARPLQPAGDLVVSRPCTAGEPCTSTWTLTSRLGQVLTFYERDLGARDRTLGLLGIEFTTASRPRIWYPDFGGGPRHIIVQLTAGARTDERRGLFELAHEAFHLMSPITPGTRASRLEEGLASWFALRYLGSIGQTFSAAEITDAPYRKAHDEIAALAEAHPDFLERLRQLRQATGSFSQLTAADLEAAFPALSPRHAAELARAF